MPKELINFLAGAFCPYFKENTNYSDWRDFVIQGVRNPVIKFYDPRFHTNQLCPATFTMGDADGILKSDILLHYRTKGQEDEGASWEQGIAFACNLLKQKPKLIIYTDETNAPFPLHFASANLTFSSLETAVEFLNKIKSIDKKEWIPHHLEIINKDRSS